MSNVDEDIPGVWPVNFCLGEAQSALGAAMIDRVEDINNIRKERFFSFANDIKDIDGISVQKIPMNVNPPFTYFLLN